jgi:signal transduction histidine kinase
MKHARKDDERPATEPAAKAADRVRDLERKLAEQAELNRQSAETWREAVHDLRGYLGVIKNSITLLNQERVPETMRAEFLTMLRESVASMNALLNDLSK